MLTLRRSALFANLKFGTGKDINMIATRPPGGSVFLVEDEVMIRMMVTDMLEELGYSVAAEAGEINEDDQAGANHRVRPRHSRRQRQRQGDFSGCRIDQGTQPPLHLRDRIWLLGSSGRISRPSGVAKAFQLETLAKMIDATALKSATV
jgi:hypothetical protein